MQMFSLASGSSTASQHWKGISAGTQAAQPTSQASGCCRDITGRVKATGCVEVSTLDRQARGAQHLFLSFRNHRKQEGGLQP